MRIFVFLFLFLGLEINVYGYSYERRLLDSKIVHVLSLNLNEYKLELIKANNGKGGREFVSSIAKKNKANVAINGGFFEIGGKNDGKPSGTLLINGEVYSIKDIEQPLLIISNNDLQISYSNPKKFKKEKLSIVSGMPLLVENGNIPKEIFDSKSDFYSNQYARTAIGNDLSNRIIIVFSESHYSRDISSLTLAEINSLLKEKRKNFLKKYNKNELEDLTLKELKLIIREEFSNQKINGGLTILELAKLMKDLGSHNAVNLDGGGSSTLWVDSKIINTPYGDKDEALGESKERAVSDAIIFVKK